MKIVDKLLGRTPVREVHPKGGRTDPRKPLQGNRKHMQDQQQTK